MDYMFQAARPIWLKNRRTTRNLLAGFSCNFQASTAKKYLLRITGATNYKVYLNGTFIAYGPARAAHGYVRADELALFPRDGDNRLSVEVEGYYCSSFYSIPMDSFLCAELSENGKVVKYTGRDFKGLSLEKMKNIYAHRYSYQRTYGEVWNYSNKDILSHWKTADNVPEDTISVFDIPYNVIPRSLPFPIYKISAAEEIAESGIIRPKELGNLLNVRYIKNISNEFDGYRENQWTENPAAELYGDFIPDNRLKDGKDLVVKEKEYVIFKLPFNNTGFIRNAFKANKDSRICVFFAEYNYGDGMIFSSFDNAVNIVKYNLTASDEVYRVETFEPYTCQYIGVAVAKGEAEIQFPSIREYSYPEYKNAEFISGDRDLNLIFQAAVNTFRQNTLDVYMDCPSRERGGWLCDSYFTAMSERFFAGSSKVEKVFLDNFTMAEEFPNIPCGMIPMVYPSDSKQCNAEYIPQWAMWYVIELGDYMTREKTAKIESYRNLCYDLLSWLERYENSDGLLEQLDGWNFVEWSKANDWVWDVNYPTNMLYCKMLYIMGSLFDDKRLIEKSDKVREAIINQSFDGEFFKDNAVRDAEGVLSLTDNCSETCQYYACFFDIADDRPLFKDFKQNLIENFGPYNRNEERTKKIIPANAFIGDYLRILVLLRMKEFAKATNDIRGYFLKMAETTGTLWEKIRCRSFAKTAV